MNAVRSVLSLIRADHGAFAETKTLLMGAKKADDPSGARFKSRVAASDVQKMTKWLDEEVGRGDIADSFTIAWQFCMRFGSEVVGLGRRDHSEISVENQGGQRQVCVQLRQRKGNLNPDPVGWQGECDSLLLACALCRL